MAYWDTFDGQAIRVLEGSEEGDFGFLLFAGDFLGVSTVFGRVFLGTFWVI